MGEYASYQGQRTKIGTCENMYYLRHDQAKRVRALAGNIDPVGDQTEIRYRFPFPDEDNIEPGEFGDFSRGALVPGVRVQHPDIDHDSWRVADRSACTPEEGIEVVMQRYWEGKLITLVRCAKCQSMYRLETIEMALPVIEAFRNLDTEFGIKMAVRILGGYSTGPMMLDFMGVGGH